LNRFLDVCVAAESNLKNSNKNNTSNNKLFSKLNKNKGKERMMPCIYGFWFVYPCCSQQGFTGDGIFDVHLFIGKIL
jgi:hypothetical protein